MMERERFEAIVDSYGADPLRWPMGERAAAQEFADRHPDIAGPLLSVGAALDVMLSEVAAPSLAPEFRARLEAQARPRLLSRLRGLLDWPGPVWQPGGVVAAALVLGLVVGTEVPVFTETASSVEAENGISERALFDPVELDEGFLQ